MPSTLTHALTGILPAVAIFPRSMPRRFWLAALVVPTFPDLDVIGFRLGVDYGHFFGHRGFFHSLCFALLLSLALTLDMRGIRRLSRRWWAVLAFFFGVLAAHDLLDAMTNGGLGIALLSPFDNTRYFFPWTPIQVSPIGLGGFLTRWGAEALWSEVKYVWLPVFAFSLVAYGLRRTISARACKVPARSALVRRSPEDEVGSEGT